jgi:hypothetical protein
VITIKADGNWSFREREVYLCRYDLEQLTYDLVQTTRVTRDRKLQSLLKGMRRCFQLLPAATTGGEVAELVMAVRGREARDGGAGEAEL